MPATTEQVQYVRVESIEGPGSGRTRRWRLAIEMTSGEVAIVIDEDGPAVKLVRELRKLASRIEQSVNEREEARCQ